MHVTYKGPSRRDDISTEFIVRDEGGKVHSLRKGVATDVPDELGSALVAGDEERFKGHKFAESSDEEREEAGLEQADTAKTADAGGGGGAGGSPPPPSTQGGTATAAART